MELQPKVQRMADELCRSSAAAGIQIKIVRAFRTHEEQNTLYELGRTEPGAIVTNARGGQSFHNFGVAFDIAPLYFRDIDEKLELRNAVGLIGEDLGLEWGGRWAEFPDPPHFQYTARYTIEEFKNNAVDWHRFA